LAAQHSATALDTLSRRFRTTRSAATPLRPLLERELREGRVEIRYHPLVRLEDKTAFRREITIRNAYYHLPVRLDRLDLEATGVGGQAFEFALERTPGGVLLKPGQTWKGQIHVALKTDLPCWMLGRRFANWHAGCRLTPVARLVDERALRELQLPSTPRTAAVEMTANLSITFGIPWWVVIGLAVSVVAAAMGALRLREYRPAQQLVGSLIGAGEQTGMIDLGVFRKPEVYLGPGQEIPVEASGTSGLGIMAVLRMVEEGDYARLALESRHPDVMVNERPVNAPQPLEVGNRIRIGNVSFTLAGETRARIRFLRPRLLLLGLLATALSIGLLFFFADCQGAFK